MLFHITNHPWQLEQSTSHPQIIFTVIIIWANRIQIPFFFLNWGRGKTSRKLSLLSTLPHCEQVRNYYQTMSSHTKLVAGFAGTQQWSLLCRREATAPPRVLNAIQDHRLCRPYTGKWASNKPFYKWDHQEEKEKGVTSFQSIFRVVLFEYFVCPSELWHLTSLPLICAFPCTS